MPIKDKFNKIKNLISSIEKDVEKFCDNNNKAAGRRVRKAMQEMRENGLEIRKDISSQNNKNKTKQK